MDDSLRLYPAGKGSVDWSAPMQAICADLKVFARQHPPLHNPSVVYWSWTLSFSGIRPFLRGILNVSISIQGLFAVSLSRQQYCGKRYIGFQWWIVRVHQIR